MTEIVTDAVMDTIRLFPFLFLTYLALEWTEHRAEDMTKGLVRKSGQFGPFIGAVCGAVPQCGFSAAAGSLYAGRVITMGTLFAIYLSTSDEMLPILLSEKAPLSLIAAIVLCKILIGMCAGFAVDFLMRRRQTQTGGHIGESCSHGGCRCGSGGIVKAALRHTLQVTFFIFLVTLGLNYMLHSMGAETVAALFPHTGIRGELAAGLIGLIPNCAASVMVTQLYLQGVLDFGALLSGLLTGSGAGLLVLFQTNHNWKENIGITAGLYLTGTACGVLVNAIGLI